MRRSAIIFLSNLVLIGAVVGCGGSDKSGPREIQRFPVTMIRDLDLLFVIDDSLNMTDKQNNLAAGFPALLSIVGGFPGGLPNLHIGVVTSDLGTQGAADTSPSFGPPVGATGRGRCAGVGKDGNLQLFGAAGMLGGQLFISDVADPVTGMRTRNYAADDMSQVFAAMVGAGSTGCGFEQHLEAVRHALRPENMMNRGFLRSDAALGVIIVADEDDCSLAHYAMLGPESPALGPIQSFRCTRFGVTCDQGGKTPDEMNMVGAKQDCHPSDSATYLTAAGDHAAFLKGLKSDPGRIVVAAIAGTTEPVATELRIPMGGTVAVPALAHSCTYLGGDIDGDGNPDPESADPPIRLKAFLDEFENRSALASICEQDIVPALAQIGELLKTTLGIPCMKGILDDTDPGAPGAQYDCRLTVEGPTIKRDLPRCNRDDASASNQPCWHMVRDSERCPFGDYLSPTIEGRDALPSDAYVTASCALDTSPPAF